MCSDASRHDRQRARRRADRASPRSGRRACSRSGARRARPPHRPPRRRPRRSSAARPTARPPGRARPRPRRCGLPAGPGNPTTTRHAPGILHAVQFRRIDDLPPYVFATVDELKRRPARGGTRRRRPRLRQPGHPVAARSSWTSSPRRRRSRRTIATPRAAASRACARRSPSCTRGASACASIPSTQVVADDRRQGRPRAPDVGAARAGRRRRRADAELPDPPRRAAARRRDRRRRAHVDARRIEEALRAATPAPRVLVVSFPHNPTTATATPELMQRLVDLARERELDHRARLRVRRHRVRRPRAAVDPAGGGRGRVRGRALQPDEVVLDGRLARRLRRRPRRRRAGAREAQVLPRLRDVPADPDRVDRRAARHARTTPSRSARSTAAGATRSARGLARAGWHVEPPRGTMFVWAPIPEAFRARGLARVRAAARAGGERRGQSRASASAREATDTSASRSSRTSSGSRRRAARSASCLSG